MEGKSSPRLVSCCCDKILSTKAAYREEFILVYGSRGRVRNGRSFSSSNRCKGARLRLKSSEKAIRLLRRSLSCAQLSRQCQQEAGHSCGITAPPHRKQRELKWGGAISPEKPSFVWFIVQQHCIPPFICTYHSVADVICWENAVLSCRNFVSM